MWFVYTLLVIGAVASVINLVILFMLATALVRMIEAQTKVNLEEESLPEPPPKPKRRRGQMVEGDGLVELDKKLIPYNHPVEVVRGEQSA